MFELDAKDNEVIIRDPPYSFSVSAEYFKEQAEAILKQLDDNYSHVNANNVGKYIFAMSRGKDLARELAGLEQLIDDGVDTIDLPLMLTGEEWYARYEKEIDWVNKRGALLDGMGNIKDEDTIRYMSRAAKRASGITRRNGE